MIRHLFKLIWNRKRANALIMAEILVCFLVLAAVVTAGVYYLERWNSPLGFEWDDLWTAGVDIGPYHSMEDAERAEVIANTEVMRREISRLDEVENVTQMINVPYSGSTHIRTTWVNGADMAILTTVVTIEALNTLRLELVAGRWLEQGDIHLAYEPVVINRTLARAMFGSESPLGKAMIYERQPDEEAPELDGEDKDEEKEQRVVGIVAGYRRMGEFSSSPNVLFSQFNNTSPRFRPPNRFVIRVAPGTPAAFEEKLARTIRSLQPDWAFVTSPIETMRAREIRQRLLPLMIGSILAGFLVLMVGLGLVGVLWQNVARRTGEIGLRRALGSTVEGVRWQVLGELLMLTTLSVGLGSAVFLQLPVLQVVGVVKLGTYVTALGISLFIIYAFVLICGLYPSWLATRVQPARALQYE